jgi:anti-sigma B factor antagonist
MADAPKPILALQPHPQAIVANVVSRDLNHETAEQLQRDLTAALAAAPHSSLILDLSQVEFVPSMALGMLVKIHKTLRQEGRQCLLVGVRPLVLELIQVTGLNKLLVVHGSVDEALKHL